MFVKNEETGFYSSNGCVCTQYMVKPFYLVIYWFDNSVMMCTHHRWYIFEEAALCLWTWVIYAMSFNNTKGSSSSWYDYSAVHVKNNICERFYIEIIIYSSSFFFLFPGCTRRLLLSYSLYLQLHSHFCCCFLCFIGKVVTKF